LGVDELARRYLLLGLRLDRISPGFVDSYVGPPALAEIARAEPEPLAAELHAEALALREMAESLDGDGAAGEHRRLWFLGQLRAISALARQAGGEEIAYLDLVEELFGIPIRPIPEDELTAARGQVEAALPGRGSLHDRLAAMRADIQVAADRVLPAVEGSATRFRAATRRDFRLPRDESIEWQEAHDQPWMAYAGFLGKGRTRIEVNVDLPADVGQIAFWAAHEAYPGHHTESVTKEQRLITEAGLGEATMQTMNTPDAVLSEGLADVGLEVVMTDGELATELQRIGEMAGVRADWAAVVAVRRGLNALQGAMGNAGILLHHDGRSEGEVREYLAEVGVRSPDRLDHSMRILRDPVNRTYSFTYSEGVRLIRPWLEIEGQTLGFQRLLSEELSPAVLLRDLAAAGVARGTDA
jgi:hypothetical protein